MILYSVFIISCSLAQPDSCTKEYVGDVPTPTPIGCLMGAQSYMRKWIEDHHGIRRFIKLKCVDHRRKSHEMGRNQA